MKASHLPGRVATGAFILHSGLQKWSAGEEQAAGLHGMAASSYPMLRGIPPARFVRLLAAGEITVGAALLTPLVPTALAAAGLTAFAGGLVGMYARTPGMRQPGSVWPSPQGMAVAKDVWMLGIGLGFLIDAVSDRRGRDDRRDRRRKRRD
jgi:uncharacterized membrane protein YphA (DoxX/SURF4 family)